MPDDREYQRENYKVDHDLLQFYENILEARVRAAKALNQYKAVDRGLVSTDIQSEMQDKQEAESHFLHILDLYFDLVKYKFGKSDQKKPDSVEDKNSVHELDMSEAIELYDRCNRVLEDLDITSLENLDQGRRVIGK